MQEVWIGIGLIAIGVLIVAAVSFVAGVLYHLRLIARQRRIRDRDELKRRLRNGAELRLAAAKWARARRNCIEHGSPTWEQIEAGFYDDGREVCDPQEHATEEEYKNCPICRGGAS